VKANDERARAMTVHGVDWRRRARRLAVKAPKVFTWYRLIDEQTRSAPLSFGRDLVALTPDTRESTSTLPLRVSTPYLELFNRANQRPEDIEVVYHICWC
jgi:hypothetical protein